MTRTYNLKNDSFKEKKKEILTRGIILSIIAVIGGLLITKKTSGLSMEVLLIMTPIAGIAIFIGVRRGLKLQKEAWDSYEIIWDMETITRSQIKTKDVSIQINDVTEVIENKKGAIVKTANKSNFIFIPKELERYSELISELETAINNK